MIVSDSQGVADQSELTARCDLYLIFPPQWSPFQPFLSTPSLKAYLEQQGHVIKQNDWNVLFYHYFISCERLNRARARLIQFVEQLPASLEHYRVQAVYALAILSEYDELHLAVDQLRDARLSEDIVGFKKSVDALNLLLRAFSTAEPVVTVGASSLEVGDVLQSLHSLADFVDDYDVNPFLTFYEQEADKIATPPRYFGISIIGTEQIVPGLALGRVLKRRFPNVPIIVGGSVFSRLVDKDSLIRELFGRYFDYICRYEGEGPMDALLSSADPKMDRSPNLAFLDPVNGELVVTPLCEPLVMDDVPTPDFDDLSLELYFTPEVVLPLLATRGCYWGKCAFCYHGMIYQDRYRMRSPNHTARDVATLEQRYGVRHFSFNDEAIPPKLFRYLPDAIPSDRYFFTALYKFERVFTREDFERMHNIGFRSLYIGLETASERVQKHMLKNNRQSTMIQCLQGASDAGIWNHTFNFFGFPTESESEAEETIQFLLTNSNIIHSEGTGTFSFEHNAPVAYDPARFGVSEVLEKRAGLFNLYYEYKVGTGLDADGASRMVDRFSAMKRERRAFRDEQWIPREHLLVLLSHHDRDTLKASLRRVGEERSHWTVGDTLRPFKFKTVSGPRHYVVNWRRARVCETNPDTVVLISALKPDVELSSVQRVFGQLREVIAEEEADFDNVSIARTV